MRTNKIIGLLLLLLAVFTIVGRVIMNDAYWNIYNYVTIIISAVSGMILLKQK